MWKLGGLSVLSHDVVLFVGDRSCVYKVRGSQDVNRLQRGLFVWCWVGWVRHLGREGWEKALHHHRAKNSDGVAESTLKIGGMSLRKTHFRLQVSVIHQTLALSLYML